MSALPELIQALLDPKSYPGSPRKIELVQTQISYVFLAGDLVYKIKKPVDFGFLDFTTLEKRLHFCRKEVELNRRLCPDTYLGVVPVTGENSRYNVEGKGRAAEYAVKMRRLPREAMMDVLLTENKVTPEMIARVAGILVAFHKKAATGGEINEIGGINAVIKNTGENFEQTEKYAGMIIPEKTFRRIREYTEGFIRDNTPLFHRRAAEGRIRDCHGDLHAAHICFCEKICIYDCIEFIDRLRYTDVAAEIAFLAMDLDRYGRHDLSEGFVDAYVAKSGDKGLLKLLDFYKCYRAYVRFKVGCSQYDDPYIPAEEKEKILANTRGYYELAESYIEGDQGR
jgi:aminoglycoside phosphotransferase family enzyme